ncbi:MAG: Ig-like domain-containing protein [Candidatus Sulfotelmatobacter sp.]
MSPIKHKLRLAGAVAAILTLGLAVSCKGFFVNPTVSTITIDPPTPSVTVAATLQLTAAATYSDGSTGTLTGGTSCTGSSVCWSSSDTTVASISTGGLITGVAQGTATITAASGAITGTTTANVILSNVTNFEVCEGTFGATISCSSGSTPLTWTVPATGETQTFIAQGTSNGQTFDLTASSTWTVPSTATGISCTNDGTSPETCEDDDTAAAGTYSVIVTYGTNGLAATLNIVVQ